jgi:signal transduction histidine kinase
LDLIYQQFRNAGDLIAAEVEEQPRQWLVDLVELVDECVAVVELTHQVSIDTQADDHPVAYGDPVLVRRAVANVLDNASRAAGQSGTVHVRLGQHEGSTWVEVEDHGRGFGRIPPGRGHGLQIVDRALRSQRGSLEITDGAENGTVVRMRLPSRLTPESPR